MSTRTLYHVTPLTNVDRIRSRGLLTKFSRGRYKCVWLVDHAGLRRIVYHLAEQKRLCPRDFGVYRVTVPRAFLSRTGIPGRYRCWYDLRPDRLVYLGAARRALKWYPVVDVT